MFGYGFWLFFANPNWGVAVCVFVRTRRQYPANPGRRLWCVHSGKAFGFTPPIVAGMCDAGVCVLV